MTAYILKEIYEQIERGEEGVLCTIIESKGSTPQKPGTRMFVFPNGNILGTIGGGIFEHRVIKRALVLFNETEKTALYSEKFEAKNPDDAICGGEATVFMEYLTGKPHLIILGAGHVGKALAQIATFCGFKVTLWDDRLEFLPQTENSEIQIVSSSLDDAIHKRLPFLPPPFVVVVTRGHALDGEAIKLLENQNTAYLGVIGSTKKVTQLRQELVAQGISPSYLDSIYTPIGLSIKAETPSEIAISIMAEIIAIYRNAPINKLRLWHKETEINGVKRR